MSIMGLRLGRELMPKATVRESRVYKKRLRKAARRDAARSIEQVLAEELAVIMEDEREARRAEEDYMLAMELDWGDMFWL